MIKNLLAVWLIFLFCLNTQGQICAVNAGTDFTICTDGTISLTGIAGQPQSDPPEIRWSQIAGPNSANINSPTSLMTTVTDFIAGIYYFRLINKCQDGNYAIDVVKVTVLPLPPRALAGQDKVACNLNPIQLNANEVTAPNVGTWSSSPAGIFSNVNDAQSTFTPPAQGIYRLFWTIINGACSRRDTLTLNVSTAAAVNAGPDQTISCQGNCAQLAASNPGVFPQTGY